MVGQFVPWFFLVASVCEVDLNNSGRVFGAPQRRHEIKRVGDCRRRGATGVRRGLTASLTTAEGYTLGRLSRTDKTEG